MKSQDILQICIHDHVRIHSIQRKANEATANYLCTYRTPKISLHDYTYYLALTTGQRRLTDFNIYKDLNDTHWIHLTHFMQV